MEPELTTRLEYSEQDANAIFSRMLGRKYEMPKGFVDVKYAKPDVVAGLQYLCGDEELAEISVECYDAEKRARFVGEAAAKVKETNSQSLERKVESRDSRTSREELENSILKKVGRGVWKVSKSTIQGTVAGFTIPHYIQRIRKLESSSEPIYSNMIYSVLGGLSIFWVNIPITTVLMTHNSKLIPYVLIPQIVTNIASGIYEGIIAKRMKKEEEEKDIPKDYFKEIKEPKKEKREYNFLGEAGTRKKCYHDCNVCSKSYCSFSKR